jgi:hypothetical protein
MTEIERLIELCPCEVIIDDWIWYFGSEGCYEHAGVANNQTPRILIQEGQSEDVTIYSIAHELGHALCGKKGCRCMARDRKDSVLAEYHAEIFNLRWQLRRKNKGAMRKTLNNIEKYTVSHPYSDHVKAWNMLKKLKLWEKCKKFAESGE